MKKLLLSLVVVAASGAYVVENRAVTLAAPGPEVADSLIVPPRNSAPPVSATPSPTLQTSSLPVPPVLRVPAPAPVQTPGIDPGRAAPAPEGAIAAAPPQQSRRATSVGSIDIAEITPPVVPGAAATASDAPRVASAPPLPRVRPAAAPDVSLRVAQASAAGNQSRYVDGTYQGVSANAYYGRVEVSAVVRGGQIAAVNVLQYPNDRGRSRRINSEALPALEQEAIAAQSANVDIVSGATLTSEAYMQSLASALDKAGGNNA